MLKEKVNEPFTIDFQINISSHSCVSNAIHVKFMCFFNHLFYPTFLSCSCIFFFSLFYDPLFQTDSYPPMQL